LLDIGAWLDVNGEAIYGTTVNRITRTDDGKVQFTLSKDRRTLYAFVDNLSGNKITIPSVVANGDTPVFMLGQEKGLSWENTNGGLKIDLSRISPNESIVYTLKIPVTPYLEKPKIVISENQTFKSKTKVTLASDQEGVDLRYSFNGQPLNTKKGKKYKRPFNVRKNSIMNVQAFKKGYQPSAVVSTPIVLLTKKNGLNRQYYEGAWDSLDGMLKSDVVSEKTVYNFSFDTDKKDNFGYIYSGFIEISTSGKYQFETTSDDGSRLLINNKILIDNDGLHARKTFVETIQLKKGRHPIELQYFERGGQEYLMVEWSGPGIEKMQIPANYFYVEDK
jgi:hypothetical protein